MKRTKTGEINERIWLCEALCERGHFIHGIAYMSTQATHHQAQAVLRKIVNKARLLGQIPTLCTICQARIVRFRSLPSTFKSWEEAGSAVGAARKARGDLRPWEFMRASEIARKAGLAGGRGRKKA